MNVKSLTELEPSNRDQKLLDDGDVGDGGDSGGGDDTGTVPLLALYTPHTSRKHLPCPARHHYLIAIA